MCIFLNREKISIYLWCSALAWKVQIMAFFAIAHSQSTQIAAIQTDCSAATFCLQIGAKGLEICGEGSKMKIHNGSIADRAPVDGRPALPNGATIVRPTLATTHSAHREKVKS